MLLWHLRKESCKLKYKLVLSATGKVDRLSAAFDVTADTCSFLFAVATSLKTHSTQSAPNKNEVNTNTFVVTPFTHQYVKMVTT